MPYSNSSMEIQPILLVRRNVTEFRLGRHSKDLCNTENWDKRVETPSLKLPPPTCRAMQTAVLDFLKPVRRSLTLDTAAGNFLLVSLQLAACTQGTVSMVLNRRWRNGHQYRCICPLTKTFSRVHLDASPRCIHVSHGIRLLHLTFRWVHIRQVRGARCANRKDMISDKEIK